MTESNSGLKAIIGPIITIGVALVGAYGVTQYDRGIALQSRNNLEHRLHVLEAWQVRTEGNRYTNDQGQAHVGLPWHPKAGEAIAGMRALLNRLEVRVDRIERDHSEFKRRSSLKDQIGSPR